MNKEIKITAAVDDVSFGKALRKLEQIREEMKKIVELSKEVSLGGIVGVGSKRSVTGTGNTAISSKGQNINVGVSGVDTLTKTAESYKNLGRTVKDVFREIGSHTGLPIGSLEKMFNTVTRLQAAFKGLGTAATTATKAASTLARPGMAGPPGLSAGQSAEIGHLLNPGPPGLGANESAAVRDIMAGRTPGGGGVAGAALRLPGWARVGLPIAGAAVGLGLLGMHGYRASYEAEVAQTKYGLQQPFWAGSRQAQFGSMYGGAALAIKGGDIAESIGMRRALASRGGQELQSGLWRQRQENDIKLGTPQSLGEAWRANRTWSWFKSDWSRAWNRIGNMANGALGRATDPNAGDWNNLGKGQLEIAREQGMQALPMRQHEEMQRLAQEERMKNPVYMARVNRIYSSALGDFGLARMAGLSGGIGTRRRPDGTIEKFDTIHDFNRRSLQTMFAPGEIAGQMQTTLGAAGSRGGVGTAASLLSAQMGGLGNATGLYGLGAQFGARGFYGGFQGLLGRGGVGGVAGSQLGAAVMGGMNSGNFTGFQGANVGLGFAGVMADATMTGDPGTDIRRARQVQGGLGAMGNIMAGGIDPLQQALNMSAALKAMPKGSYAAHKALMDMDPATRLEIIRSGKLPAWMSESGVGMNDVQGYLGAQASTYLSRVSTKMVQGTGLEGTLNRMREAGGVSYIKDLKGKNRQKEIARASRLLNLGGLGSLDDMEGLIHLGLAEAGGRRARGRGVGAGVDKKGARGTAVGVHGKFEGEESDALVDENGNIITDVKDAPSTYNEAERTRREGQGNFGALTEPAAAAAAAADMLMRLARALEKMNPAPRRALAP